MEPRMNTDEHRYAVTRGLCSSVFICGFLSLSVSAQAQTLYKCLQANGRVLYQQEPCPDPRKQSLVRPPDPVAAKSEAELRAERDQAAKGAEAEMGEVIQVIADASLCTGDVPGWDDRNGAAIREWKIRNGKAVARFDQDQEARRKAMARMDMERGRFAVERNRNALAESCERLASRLRAPAPAAAKK
jgi:hypothetical protein